MARNYTKTDIDQLRQLISESITFTDVAKKLGRKPVGGTLAAISLQCKLHSIDTSHMLGHASSKGKVSAKLKPVHELLVMGVEHSHRVAGSRLRRALLSIGVEYKCATCGLTNWLGKKIILEVDHIDGRYWNNLKDNLQLLCPNCHSCKTYCLGG